MKCMECGEPLKVTRETIEYRQGGLPGVRLRNIEVRRCPEDGEIYEVIPRIEELHALLARAVATKSAKLTPHEVVFLRNHLAQLTQQLQHPARGGVQAVVPARLEVEHHRLLHKSAEDDVLRDRYPFRRHSGSCRS